MKEHNDTYLTEWLAGNLTDEQFKAFVSPEDFEAFQKIKFTLDTVQIQSPDLDKNFESIKQKLASKKTVRSGKVISLWR